MIRRSFNTRFRQPILDGIKITTIRDNAWPVGVPIMAFNWSALPYRSKQAEISPIIVEETTPIRIGRVEGNTGMICYHAEKGIHPGRLLWSCEGFYSKAEMDEWFRPKLKPGEWVGKTLHRFRLAPECLNLELCLPLAT